MIHTVKGFCIVSETEVDVFLEFSCFLYDPANVGNFLSGSSAFSKSSLKYRNSQLTYCWSLAWRIFSITLLAWEMSAIVWWSEHSLVLPFFGIGMRIDFFQACGHCWVFQICWHECSTLIVSSFMVLNSFTVIPGEGNGNPLQYSCLENPMDGGAWWATVHGLQRVGYNWATSLSLSL